MCAHTISSVWNLGIMKINGILFDLDGTLLDTAPDLCAALNYLRALHHLAPLPLSIIRDAAGAGFAGLMKVGLNIEPTDPRFPELSKQAFAYYEEHLLDNTQLFSGMEEVLTYLENENIPWGIVTNKPKRFTDLIAEKLHLSSKTNCIISGDSLENRKPHPEPVIHACQLLNREPQECLFIGDAKIDVMAGKAAGTKALIAMYGYIPKTENPALWQADGQIHHPLEIMQWLG